MGLSVRISFLLFAAAGLFLYAKPAFSGSETKSTFDKKSLESGTSQTTGKKALKRHHRRKAQRSNVTVDPNTQGSQEEVTDQREVSQQSDQKGRKK